MSDIKYLVKRLADAKTGEESIAYQEGIINEFIALTERLEKVTTKEDINFSDMLNFLRKTEDEYMEFCILNNSKGNDFQIQRYRTIRILEAFNKVKEV